MTLATEYERHLAEASLREARLLALDPGKQRCGWALYEAGALRGAGVWVAPLPALGRDVPLARDVVVEVPQVYGAGRDPADPNDLVDLSVSAGFVAARAEPSRVRLVRPREWKGQLPKDVCARRARGRLTGDEIEVAEREVARVPARFRGDAWDAIGVGLWALGRFT